MSQHSPKAKYRLDYTAPNYTITDIDLDFQLSAEVTTVTARSQVIRQNAQANTLVLEGEALTLISVNIDEQPWSNFEVKPQQLWIHDVPDNFTLTIVNEIKPIDNTALEGLYVSEGALCTQCEAEGFRHITYYLDRPDVLARFRTRITANKEKYPFLLSNGNRIAEGDLANNQHWVEWYDPFPKPSYLFALVAGDFDILKDKFITRSQREITLEIYVDRGNLDRTQWAMESLKNAMRWDEQRFNLEYDLDIFMIVAVDFFNMGAMENKGLNIFNSKFVLAKAETATDDDYLGIESVIGHEYFHNWTGNRVTCRDWFQLSLKEGLTVFRDQEFSADLGSRAVNRINNVKIIRGPQFTEDASPMSHPIRPDQVIEMNNFYTVTVYEKGSEVIRMLHTLLGETQFQAGMRYYFECHDGTAATCDDFIQAMADASQIDLTQFKRWYSQSGTPELFVTTTYNECDQTYQLTVKQLTPSTVDQKEKQPLHIPLDIELYDQHGQIIPLQYQGRSLHSVLDVNASEQTFTFDCVPNNPVIALLREFSAPVKLHYNYSTEDLIFLMQHATNDFNRYDAAQMLFNQNIQENVARFNMSKSIALSEEMIDAFRGILLSTQLDPALIALIVMPPSENEIANQFEVVNPDAIHWARQQIILQMANLMADEWLAIYHTHQTHDYHIEHHDIAKRALKNASLFYIAHLTDNQCAQRLVKAQYAQANNMTDTIAALGAAVRAQLSCRHELMRDFEQQWHQDGLVMDKWFMLQATNPAKDALQQVKQLLTHRSFSLANPNRIRSLIGAFVSNNPVAFHASNGQGYHFLVEILTELNQKNPQVAARLIDPLIRYKRYDLARQQRMKAALEQLLTLPHLSNDLYEKITKALAD
ncbi:aminopeptidase N [Utexia brackfieldae]|uniref:aminopeptidase N n=1 Tax=Utexia brackfieldae TaxID=3074108 RepID=UPI00370DCD5A